MTQTTTEKRSSIYKKTDNKRIDDKTIELWIDRAINGPNPEGYDFILPGLTAGTVGQIAGGGSTGKTFFAIQTAISLSHGKDIFGFFRQDPTDDFKGKKRKIMYITYEDDADTILRRIDAVFRFLVEKKKSDKLYKDIDIQELKRDVIKNFIILDLSGEGSDAWIAGVNIDDKERREKEDDII